MVNQGSECGFSFFFWVGFFFFFCLGGLGGLVYIFYERLKKE